MFNQTWYAQKQELKKPISISVHDQTDYNNMPSHDKLTNATEDIPCEPTEILLRVLDNLGII